MEDLREKNLLEAEITDEQKRIEEENKLREQQEEESLADRVKVISPGRLVLKRFFRSKLSMLGLAMLIFLFAFSFLGPIFSPYGEVEKTGEYKWFVSVIPHKLVIDEVDDNGNTVRVVYDFYEVSDPYKVYSKTPPSS